MEAILKGFNLVDFDNLKTRFLSKNQENSWAQYDFGERKVRPTHYSIRSRPNSKGEYHLKGWVRHEEWRNKPGWTKCFNHVRNSRETWKR